MTMLEKMKADTSILLDEWGESLSFSRAVQTWSSGKATQSWANNSTFVGDWQPLSGAEIRAEEGLTVRSDAKVICRTDETVAEGDRCYRADGTFMYVNYIKKYNAHWTLFLTKAEPQ